MSTPTIEFFWDCASPYTYLAATQVGALAARTGAAVEWKPFLLGKVFEATGNRMPGSLPAKGRYLMQDLKLWARYYQVALRFPSTFPINSLLPQRLACAATGAGRGEDCARALMAAYWTRGQDVSQRGVLETMCDALGLERRVLEQVDTPAVKDLLRANTEEAVRRGAFGAPTFFVGTQMFWGNDRLLLMEAWLNGRLSA